MMREAQHDWPNLKAEVREFVRQCPMCQFIKAGKSSKGQEYSLATTETSKWSVDPKEFNVEGFDYKYLVVN